MQQSRRAFRYNRVSLTAPIFFGIAPFGGAMPIFHASLRRSSEVTRNAAARRGFCAFPVCKRPSVSETKNPPHEIRMPIGRSGRLCAGDLFSLFASARFDRQPLRNRRKPDVIRRDAAQPATADLNPKSSIEISATPESEIICSVPAIAKYARDTASSVKSLLYSAGSTGSVRETVMPF